MEDFKQYHRNYQKERYHRIMGEMRKSLGNRCAFCGTTEGPFQIDHVNPKNKTSNLTKLWSRTQKIREHELRKCQLLCGPCHDNKTLMDFGKRTAKGVHGTISSYRYCKCTLCRAAKSKSNREQRLARLRAQNND